TGSAKCACGPQAILPYSGYHTAKADRVNPCGVPDASYQEKGANPSYCSGINPSSYVNQAIITCKAGQWYR
ncbi:hypothetical protein PRIPAC_75772, partial [Pristionchus pacificus]|uniref:Uncharacterized protein n=1 Tax=Pristionchus pacificus TaxID=54126 RepID=A0A2A6C139_PRIPA